MRKLAVDFGNTLQKLAVFDGKTMLHKETFRNLEPAHLREFVAKNGPFGAVILSSVTNHSQELEKILADAASLVILDENTPLPVKNRYHTPESLGKDRLAAVVGAGFLYPGKNILAIDAGTCITYDFLTATGDYLGGGISPGIAMRFRALHTFTGKLPLVEPESFSELIGKDTRQSILSGVLNGVVEEVTGIINRYRKEFRDVSVVITGGDHDFLHNNLKINIFAVPDLVLQGLNEILDNHDLES